MFGAERGCLAVMWPLASHPTVNKNELLAWERRTTPAGYYASPTRSASVCSRARLTCPSGNRMRLPLKSVHLNKSPMVK